MLKIKEKVKTFCKRSKQAVMSSITALTISYMHLMHILILSISLKR